MIDCQSKRQRFKLIISACVRENITWQIAAIIVPRVRTLAVVSAALEGSRTLVVVVAVALHLLAEPSILAAEE